MSNEVERIRNGAVVAYLKVLFRNFPGGTEEDHENTFRIAGSGPRFYLGPPKFESGLLTARSRRSLSKQRD
jgi:hypothetical protein